MDTILSSSSNHSVLHLSEICGSGRSFCLPLDFDMQQQFTIQESSYSDKSSFRTLSGICCVSLKCLALMVRTSGSQAIFEKNKAKNKRNTEI